MKRFAILATTATLLFFSACMKLDQSELLSSNMVFYSNPFAGFNPSATDIYNATLMATGNPLVAQRYVLSSDGDSFGTISLSGGVINMARLDVSGPCTNSSVAPNCPFTWGSGSTGAYHGGDYNYFPNVAALSNQFKLLKTVSVDVHQQLLTGDFQGGMSDCGIALGFGSGAGSPNASAASSNLQIAGRTTNDDLVRFTHRITNAGDENVQFEAPINPQSDSSLSPWGTASWSTSFKMTKDSPLTANNDYVDFRMLLTFDHVAQKVTIFFLPLATNKTLSSMHSQTLTFAYTAAPGTTVGGEPRAGIALNQGSQPLTSAALESSRASIGFSSNGVSKSCSFSNVIVGVLKTPES